MYVISLDLGTSGFRSQLIDLEKQETIKTVITMGHPLPGGNVIDHLNFAIVTGADVAHRLILETVVRILEKFDVDPDKIVRISVCGNPIQLSLFQNIEIRDLAYAGKNKQEALGVQDVKRDARVFPANEIFKGVFEMNNCEIVIPPAIKHEIGADALAMMLETDFMHQTEPCLVTDYGTNAEMALKIGDRIITASAAAGPAIEGQGIDCGMLAGPGAISDVNIENGHWRLTVLDNSLSPLKGPLVDPVTGNVIERTGAIPKGITGTGVISTIALAIKSGLIKKLPKVPNGRINLWDGIYITDKDVEEVGKAIGAIRAAHMTFLVEAGLKYEDLKYCYMSGATGTYVDAEKARYIGSVPGFSEKIVQFGNTSIGLARKIALDITVLEEVKKVAKKIQADHLMMATSEVFKDIYMCELATWQDGMPADMYDQMLEMYNILPFPKNLDKVDITKKARRDIDDVGYQGLDIVKDIGIILEAELEKCVVCHLCEEDCPEDALTIIEKDGGQFVNIDSQHCLGTSCRRCVSICPEQTMNHAMLKVKGK